MALICLLTTAEVESVALVFLGVWGLLSIHQFTLHVSGDYKVFWWLKGKNLDNLLSSALYVVAIAVQICGR